EGALRRMAAALAHRGPDDLGIHRAGAVGLVNTRLSIIDLEGGHQPMVDDRFALVANGEIYNFVELRPLLEARGRRFRSGPGRAGTARSSSTPTRWTACARSPHCTGCSPSPSTIRKWASSCSPATASASSRSTTRSSPTGFFSPLS